MYSLLIVEDEKIIREGLHRIIHWDEVGFQVVGAVKNGQEALDFIASTPVDAVLLDIRMPKMSGIEFMKMLRKQSPDIFVVILSGYDRFDYARAAIEHGAFAYLLKPVRKTELIQVFARVRKRLDSQRQLSSDLQDASIRALLIKVADNAVDEAANLKLQELLGGYSGFAFMALEYCLRYMAVGREKDSQLFNLEATLESIHSLMSKDEAVIPIRLTDRRMVVLLCGSEETRERAAAEISRILAERNDRDPAGGFTVALGRSVESVSQLRSAFLSALSLLRWGFLQNKGVLITEACAEKPRGEMFSADVKNAAEHIAAAVVSLNGQKALLEIDHLLGEIRAKNIADANEVLAWVQELLVWIRERLAAHGLGMETVTGGPEAIVEEARRYSTLEDVGSLLKDRIMKLTRETSERQNQPDSIILRRAVQAIRSRFADDLSLKTLGSELGVTGGYLSKLFRKNLGINFKNYLTDMRISHAKELLTNEVMKVYEVGEAVGVRDPRYFSMLFKYRTGMTPSEFRRKLREHALDNR